MIATLTLLRYCFAGLVEATPASDARAIRDKPAAQHCIFFPSLTRTTLPALGEARLAMHQPAFRARLRYDFGAPGGMSRTNFIAYRILPFSSAPLLFGVIYCSCHID